MKSIFMVLIVALVASCASASMHQQQSPKGLVDTILATLGFDKILASLQSVGTALYSQLLSLATQVMLQGQNMWQQALPVFNNLVAELTAHTGNAVQLVSQAVLQLTSVLANGPARSASRGILDTITEAFGLNQIFSMIQNVGSGLYSQFVALATQLLFAGQQMWQQALPVFNNLVAELTAHTGNAVQLVSQAVLQLTSVLANGPQRSAVVERIDLIAMLSEVFNLGGVISTIQSVGTGLYSQLVSLMTQLVFAGQQMWAQATPVFNNLVAELTAHTGNAVQLVSQAVLQLTSVLANGPQRFARASIIDSLISGLGLNQVWSLVQSVGTGLYSQLLSLMTQLVFAGQNMWAQAQPVFNNLVAELTAHTGNAVQLVSQAVLQLTSVLASGPARSIQRAGLLDTIINATGLNQIWSAVQSVGTSLYSQFLGLLTQLLFAGQQMWAQATPVFNNLVAELTAHTGNAVQLVSQAVLQLTSVLANGPNARFNILDTIISATGLGNIWSAVQSVGNSLYTQLVSLMTQLVFAGQQMWTQAMPVFNNLVAELTAHTGNAVQLVSQAVLQLTSVLANGPQRFARAGLLDSLISGLGLNQVWSLVQSVGTGLYSQLLSLMTQLVFAG
jgi:hypothetical protein